VEEYIMKFIDDPFGGGNISPSSSGWQSCDITSLVGGDAGSVTGAILWVRSFAASGENFSVRPTGSSFTANGQISNNSGCFHYVKVDSNDAFDMYQEDYTKFGVFLWGYTTDDDGSEWLDEPYDITPGSAGAFEATTNVDDQFNGTPEVIFAMVYDSAATLPTWGLQDIDGDDYRGYLPETQGIEGGVTECTGGECEVFLSTLSNTSIYLLGALTGGALTKWSSSYDPTSAATWEEVDESTECSSGDKAIIYHYHDGVGEDLDTSTRCIPRKDGQTWDDWAYFHGRRAVKRLAPINESTLKFDIKVEDAAVLVYMFGSIADGVGSPSIPGQVVTVYQDDIV
jgi:hypothetical protein